MGELLKIFRRTFTVTPVVDTSAYAAGDAIDVLQSIDDAVRSADQAGIIEQISIVDASGQDAALDLVLYTSVVTDGVDNAAYDPSEADLKESVGAVSILATDYSSLVNNSVATVQPNFHMQFNATTTLRFQIVSRGTPTYAGADDLQIRFVIKQD